MTWRPKAGDRVRDLRDGWRGTCVGRGVNHRGEECCEVLFDGHQSRVLAELRYLEPGPAGRRDWQKGEQ